MKGIDLSILASLTLLCDALAVHILVLWLLHAVKLTSVHRNVTFKAALIFTFY